MPGRPIPCPTDTAAQRHRVAAAAVASAMVTVALFALASGRIALPAHASFLPAFGAMTFVADLLTAGLLLAQSNLMRDRSPLQRGLACGFAALLLLPHGLALPSVLTAAASSQGSGSPLWLWSAWHGAFAILVNTFLLGRPGHATRRSDRAVSGLLLPTMALLLVLAVGSPWLPTLLADGSATHLTILAVGAIALGSTTMVAGLAVARRGMVGTVSLWLVVALLATLLGTVLTLSGGERFTLEWYAARSLSVFGGFTTLVTLLCQLVGHANRVTAANGQLQQMLCTDVLTGVANRRAFDAAMTTEWRRARREQTAISLLMVDIDLFKGFNDRYGHIAGDVCLREVATALHGQVQRPADSAARLGGEEFVLLLPNTEEPGAAKVAERVRAAVGALRLLHGGSPLGYVTISVGVATGRPFDSTADEQSLIEAADQALYRAKAAGRNAICTAPLPTMALVAA